MKLSSWALLLLQPAGKHEPLHLPATKKEVIMVTKKTNIEVRNGHTIFAPISENKKNGHSGMAEKNGAPELANLKELH